ncbi:MAG: hypothetical protein A3A72_00270, partial [Deltaproteobacteria bacterium RIFCSPLOWO2_01_FULL_38_9]
MFFSGHTEKVFQVAKKLTYSYITQPKQRDLFEVAFEGLKQDLSIEPFVPFIQIPLYTRLGMGGHEEEAYPIAALNTLLFLGIDIMDDLADGDLPLHWKHIKPADINLVAFTLLCALPQKILSDDFNKSLACKMAMHTALANGFMKMSAGQHQDLAMVQETPLASEGVLKSVIQKSGEELALFTKLGGLYHDLSSDQIGLLYDFGLHLGTAAQISSDCYDIFEASLSRDLANGARTLPLALHLEKLGTENKKSFLTLLNEVQKDPSLREVIKNELIERGSLRHAALMVEYYCQ